MTTQNWPDPKRPGAPMFPERDGAHVFENENDEDLHLVYHWNSGKQCWSDFPVNTTKQWDLKPSLQDYKYVGPVLTSAQINEMLAAERERAAKAAQEVSDTYYEQRQESESDNERIYADERMFAAQECVEAIRNLGAAP